MITIINKTENEIILMSTLLRELSTGQNQYTIPAEDLPRWAENNEVILNIANGSVNISVNSGPELSQSEAVDAIKGLSPKLVNSSSFPFATKNLEDGKKIFKRVHGVQQTLTTSNETIEFIVPYTQAKITGLEIIGANIGDVADFNVYDNAAGTISGTPNLKLNQFGFNVNISKDFHKETSKYDADLIQGMKLEVDYTGTINQLVCINFILHEVK